MLPIRPKGIETIKQYLDIKGINNSQSDRKELKQV